MTIKFALLLALVTGLMGQEQHHQPATTAAVSTNTHKGGQQLEQALLEVTLSRDFNYGLFFLPLGKNFVMDSQFYWSKSGGSEMLHGLAYNVRIKNLKLIPGLYYVSEPCHIGNKPWGCHFMAVGGNWEYEHSHWVSRGFVVHKLKDSRIRFHLADPIQFGHEFFRTHLEVGTAFVFEQEHGEDGKSEVFGKGGFYIRKHLGETVYAEASFVAGHGGPSVRLSFGKSFKSFRH